MATLTIQIEPQHLIPFNFIYTNNLVINRLGLPLGEPIELSFGSKKAYVYVRESPVKGNLIRIPSHIANNLLLPNGVKIRAKYHQSTGLKFGPLLGILVQNVQKNQPQTPFGKFTNFAIEVSEKSRAMGIIPYFFTADRISKNSDFISGWFYYNNKWEEGTFPIPSVIYNRISLRKEEEKLLPIIHKLQKQHPFVFFNNNFLNKWEVYQLLMQTATRQILPKTVKLQGIATLREILKRFSIVYLKPTNGALGNGIMRLEKTSDGYIVQSNRAQGPVSMNFKSLENLVKYLRPRIAGKTYLVQEGINLIKIDGRPIDFRILVQKNAKGNWDVTSMVARIANDKQFVSNLAQGGTISPVLETIRTASPELIKKVTRNDFKKYSIEIAKQIDTAATGLFAELGIDLALDVNGKIWLLEVNSKPSKTEDPKETNGSRPSVNRLIQYVHYVSGF